MYPAGGQGQRPLLAAEQHTPEHLHDFLRDLEACETSEAVWRRLVVLGRSLELPHLDFIVASAAPQWKRTLFLRTSYDSRWLQEANKDPEVSRWSYLRSHATQHLTPLLVGLEFAEEFTHLPEQRVAVLREAARRGMRAGFSVPLRGPAPPLTGVINYMGDHARRDMLAIVRAHGWVLNVAALAAFQRYMGFYAAEFLDRTGISMKQREMLSMIGAGLQDKQIAADLGISVSALRQRMQALMAKTGCSNRAEIAALAMSTGLLPDPQRALDPNSAQVPVMIDGQEEAHETLAPHPDEWSGD